MIPCLVTRGCFNGDIKPFIEKHYTISNTYIIKSTVDYGIAVENDSKYWIVVSQDLLEFEPNCNFHIAITGPSEERLEEIMEELKIKLDLKNKPRVPINS